MLGKNSQRIAVLILLVAGLFTGHTRKLVKNATQAQPVETLACDGACHSGASCS